MVVSYESLREAVDVIDSPLMILALDGRILHLNPAIERLLGRSTAELSGQSIRALFATERPERVPALLATLSERGRTAGAFSILRPDGSTVPAEFSAEAVRSSDGAPRWILASVRDLGPRLAQLEELNASALSLLTSPGEDLLVTIVRVARELVGTRYAALGVVEDGRLVRFIPDGLNRTEIAAMEGWPRGLGLLGAMIAERRTIRIDDISADPRSVGFAPGHPPMRSFLGTPVQSADDVYGHLYFTEKLDAAEFNLLDERLAELFASHAALAIRDHRQREALEASRQSLAGLVRQHALILDAAGEGFYGLLGRPQDGRGPGPWPSRIAVEGQRPRRRSRDRSLTLG